MTTSLCFYDDAFRKLKFDNICSEFRLSQEPLDQYLDRLSLFQFRIHTLWWQFWNDKICKNFIWSFVINDVNIEKVKWEHGKIPCWLLCWRIILTWLEVRSHDYYILYSVCKETWLTWLNVLSADKGFMCRKF